MTDNAAIFMQWQGRNIITFVLPNTKVKIAQLLQIIRRSAKFHFLCCYKFFINFMLFSMFCSMFFLCYFYILVSFFKIKTFFDQSGQDSDSFDQAFAVFSSPQKFIKIIALKHLLKMAMH